MIQNETTNCFCDILLFTLDLGRGMTGFYTDLRTLLVSLIRASQHVHIWRCSRYFKSGSTTLKIDWVTRKVEHQVTVRHNVGIITCGIGLLFRNMIRIIQMVFKQMSYPYVKLSDTYTVALILFTLSVISHSQNISWEMDW